jgi:hypothetical protein
VKTEFEFNLAGCAAARRQIAHRNNPFHPGSIAQAAKPFQQTAVPIYEDQAGLVFDRSIG